ncbi:UDP-N-acetylglucosamine diphosphorylase/glucosamine-1-phosphate N-acetyltransferase [Corticibacter populi]|uniref:Bifunctional protein GlmU n=1 Tax=Corticibacter populi TaxID=1550736 RepID=A0A3M6QHQ1_9BURK|nr:bifunctional UDP-N-acetylglucosamine diphosphorylase/glucosamine-1-phosphate N-acetyltransferase GlmU [Corticibacter populi]RMX02624.1 UDP-N-acetylglucosamine diphosphorylase/glucosamine-1-phosphate N-acetyltransferase [Corticibacter populi]RZS32960.1 UDP-N-acetylglucosamine pyrophosphorylase /glucosamine-1-phosphate N-acetyltransferase [Corticibacter populi]
MSIPPQSTPHPLSIVVLAAGKGTRMQSQTPKVLQPLGGRPLLAHVLETAAALQPQRLITVTGHGAEQVDAFVRGPAAELTGAAQIGIAAQVPQHGTGHAVQQAVPQLPDEHMVLVLLGDVPLVTADSLRTVLALCDNRQLALLTVQMDDPSGYGRIVRDGDGQVRAIVEHKDASAAQRAIGEVNSGIMAFPSRLLKPWLQRLGNDNAQGEYYLTDLIAMACADGVAVQAHCLPAMQGWQVAGVNSPAQLAALERRYQWQQAEQLMAAGVRLADPSRFELRAATGSVHAGRLECGQDVEIDIGCIFGGQVVLGQGCRIGAYNHIANAHIGAGSIVAPYSHIDGEQSGVRVGADARIGPFARLRPGATLGDEVHIGNFVEVKNSTLAQGAKANHLAYLGDASVGARVNYGAGAITANYDGANKHRTVIGADVHIGSNSVLVAPVTIGAGGTVGAGSTITRDTPANSLTVARARAVSVSGWQRPGKKKS